MAYFTSFVDGSVVETANQMTQLRIDLPGSFRWACPAADLGEVLEQHSRAVEKFAAGRISEVAAPDLNNALECLYLQEQCWLRKQGPVLALTTPLPLLVILLIACGVVGTCFGFGNWTTAAAIILGGSVYKLVLPGLLKDIARSLREEDQESRRTNLWGWLR